MRPATVALASVVLLAAAAAWVIASDRREAARDAAVIEQRRIAGSMERDVPGPPDVTEVGARTSADVSRAPQPLVAAPEPLAAPAPDAPARVRVRALASDGTSVPGVDITVSADTPLFRGFRRRGQRPDSRPVGEEPTSMRGTQSRTQRKGLGLADFDGMLPGVAFTVHVADQFGRELRALAVEPLAPGESRLVEVPLEGALVHLRVRVIDLDGQPIDDAEVELLKDTPAEQAARHGYRWDGIRTNALGEADLGWCAAGPFALEIKRFGQFIRWESEIAASSSGEPVVVQVEPVVLRIDRGRRVVIRGSDAGGAPKVMSHVTLEPRDGDDAITWEPEPVWDIEPRGSVWYAEGVPAGVLIVTAWIDNTPIRISSPLDNIPVIASSLRLIVVTWDEGITSPNGVAQVMVKGSGGTFEGGWEVGRSECEKRESAGSLPPGRYVVTLAGRGGDGGFPPLLAAPQEVELGKRSITHVHFGAP